MFEKLITLFTFLFTTYFWTVVVLVQEFMRILKYRFEYFKSPRTIKYPESINDKKYGKSNFVNIQTTTGAGTEKLTLRLHYVINGERKGHTMLFIHGFPEFWYSWRHQLMDFGKTHRVIALDLRGYGLSDKPKNVQDYQMKHLVNDIKGLLDALEIPSVILLGHDWGGAVAWSFENEFPDMVEKFIALNIPETNAFQSVFRESWRQYFKSWYMFFFQCPYLPEWVLSRFDMKSIALAFTSKKSGLQKMKLTDDDINAFKANMAAPGALTGAINYYRATFRYTKKRNPKQNEKRTDSDRYMLIFGEADQFIEIECAKRTKKFVPNINLKLLPGLSHWIQQDDPVLVNRLIKEFIDS